MINAQINFIRVVDDELFNRVVAFGPGDGINRVSVTVEDANSIANFGLRQKVETFIEATSRDNLETLALAYLAEHKEPVTEMSITLFSDAGSAELESVLYNGEAVTYGGEEISFWKYGEAKELRRGDTIRIVSQSLRLNTTGVVEEVEWEPGQVTLTINKKRYNLLEVINGPEREDERTETSLGLPVPLSFRAQRADPGVRVFVNPYTNSRASGVEVYASTTPAFTPTREFLLVKGTSTEFLFPSLESGLVWYFRARSYDNQGNYSDFTNEAAAVSGYVQGGRIEPGSITDLTPFASALKAPRLVLSLPVVPSPDYELGDLVAFEGDLYVLESETGVPETDWQPLTDLSELDGRLVANRLVAAQIEAGAIRAEQIAADAVTAEKILVNGPVTVANEDTAQDGAFVVLDASSQEVLRLGAGIDGKPGVPSGTDYGLWGALGTGVFIQGAASVVGAGSLDLGGTALSSAPYDEGEVIIFEDTATISSSWVVPTGKQHTVMVSMQNLGFGGVAPLVLASQYLQIVRTAGPTIPTWSTVLSAGTYTNLGVETGITAMNPGPTTIASGTALSSVRASYIIIETDA